jgi:hypothetical protein
MLNSLLYMPATRFTSPIQDVDRSSSPLVAGSLMFKVLNGRIDFGSAATASD